VQVSVLPEKRNVLQGAILIKINVLTEQKESVCICIKCAKSWGQQHSKLMEVETNSSTELAERISKATWGLSLRKVESRSLTRPIAFNPHNLKFF